MTSTNEKKKKRKDIVESLFLVSMNFSFNIICIAPISTELGVLIYVYMDVSSIIMCYTSVNLPPCCIKHATRFFSS